MTNPITSGRGGRRVEHTEKRRLCRAHTELRPSICKRQIFMLKVRKFTHNSLSRILG
jgi:hypothetical protein